MIKKIAPLFSVPVMYIFESGRSLTYNEFDILNNLKETEHQNNLSENQYVLNLPGMEDLKLFCQDAINEYAHDTCGVSDNFYITNSWTTRNPIGVGHPKHVHPNSIFSGVYYINASEETAPFTLHSESPIFKKFNLEYHYTNYSIFNSNDWSFPVKSGSLIIFPSWVEHSSSVNKSTTDRRLLGFNSFVKGKFGDFNYCSSLELH